MDYKGHDRFGFCLLILAFRRNYIVIESSFVNYELEQYLSVNC